MGWVAGNDTKAAGPMGVRGAYAQPGAGSGSSRQALKLPAMQRERTGEIGRMGRTGEGLAQRQVALCSDFTGRKHPRPLRRRVPK
jgi:hypothetical protein